MTSYISEEFKTAAWPYVAAGMKKEKTRHDYMEELEQFCRFSKKDAYDTNEKDFESYLVYLRKRRESGALKESSLKYKVAVLHSIYKTLIAEGIFEEANPVAPKYVTSDMSQIDPMKIPSYEDLDEILERAKSDEAVFLMVVLASRMAFTVGELSNLKVENLRTSRAGEKLMVYEYRNTERVKKVPEDVVKILENYLVSQEITSSYLFKNKRLGKLSVRDMEKHYAKAVYGKDPVIYTLQSLRNLSVVGMLAGGVDKTDVAIYSGMGVAWISRYERAVDSERFRAADGMNIRIVREE